MPSLLLFILALGMAIYSFRQFRRDRWRLSLVMLIFWCVLAVQLVTGQKWLQLILVSLLLPAAYFRFIAKYDQEKKPDAAAGSASRVADETEPGFDRLIDEAEQQPGREHYTRLNRALLLSKWHTVMVERDGETRPYVGVVEDTPALLLFTDTERAQVSLALIDRLHEPGEVRIGAITPAEIVRDPEHYRALGVKRLQFNLRYYLPLDGLRDQFAIDVVRKALPSLSKGSPYPATLWLLQKILRPHTDALTESEKLFTPKEQIVLQ